MCYNIIPDCLKISYINIHTYIFIYKHKIPEKHYQNDMLSYEKGKFNEGSINKIGQKKNETIGKKKTKLFAKIKL